MLQETIQFGPVLLKVSWLIIFFSLLCAYAVMIIYLRKDETLLNELSSILGNSFLLYIVIFKFSFLFFRPSMLLHNWKGILFFTGGTKGAIIGFVISLLYITFQLYKRRLFMRKVLFALLYGGMTAVITESIWIFVFR
ncbi:hypothetical protein [Bacillus alveayuensis]|uniref:hypothetical protein n=1 Tax=Aeribacillus alveayuensis TaxID=279215 RepID=UPI0005CD1B20|nr:hypothetical protein [Bacillus alveayuensis]